MSGRSHWGRNGQPKNRHPTYQSALRRARELEERSGEFMAVYLCNICSRWHVAHRRTPPPGYGFGARRDADLRVELGVRAMGCLSVENAPIPARRLEAIADRVRACWKRLARAAA